MRYAMAHPIVITIRTQLLPPGAGAGWSAWEKRTPAMKRSQNARLVEAGAGVRSS
jgi:hypothetical protein